MKTISFPLRHKLFAYLHDIDIIGVRTLASKLPKLLIPHPKGKVLLQTLYGFRLWIDPATDKGIERSLYYTGTYERGTLEFIGKLLSEGDWFVDAGANIGLMSVFAAKCVGKSGKVYAFEPNPATYDILKSNIHVNNLENVQLMPIALGAGPGKAILYDRWESNRGSASLIKPAKVTTSAEIEIMILDDCLPIGKIRLAKFDIEGFELEALKGFERTLCRPDAPILIIENSDIHSHSGSNSESLFAFLSGINDYNIYKSLRKKNRISKLVKIKSANQFPHNDNIYCFLPAHIESIKDRSLFHS